MTEPEKRIAHIVIPVTFILPQDPKCEDMVFAKITLQCESDGFQHAMKQPLHLYLFRKILGNDRRFFRLHFVEMAWEDVRSEVEPVILYPVMREWWRTN